MASPQATEAAARKRRERVAALGAVTLPDAAAARGIDVTTMQKWAPRSESAFRGPQRMWLFRDTELDAELEQWRCTWEDGCPEFALLSTSSPRRCKRHAADVDRRGGVLATELARELGVDPVDLLERVKNGEIPRERVDRGGRPAAYRLDRDEALAVIERDFLCRWRGGCRSRGGHPGYALGESRHCREHAAGAASIARAAGKVRVTCPGCGDVREDYPSQVRAGELCTHCHPRADRVHEAVANMRGELIPKLEEARGLVPQAKIAELYCIVPTSLSKRLSDAGVHVERHLGVKFVDQAGAEHYKRERLRTDRRALAALNLDREKKRVRALARARKRTMTADELEALETRVANRRGWLLRVSRGAPAGMRASTAAWVSRCAKLASEIVGWNWDTPPSGEAVLRQVFEADWPEHVETWPRRLYPADPRDPEHPSPAKYRTATRRLQRHLAAYIEDALTVRH
jgi:hypothetical protein